MRLRFGILFLAIVQHSFCYDDKKASEDPIREYLQLDSHSQHKVADIEELGTMHKRDNSENSRPNGKHIRIRTLDGNVDLWVHPPNSVLATDETLIYFSEPQQGEPENVRIQVYPDLMKNVAQVFEDPSKLASITIGRDSYGRVRVNGHIQSMNAVIRSLPDDVVEKYARHRRSMGDEISLNSSRHVIYTTKNDMPEHIRNYNPRMMMKREARFPDVIYPKILLSVDHSIYKKYEGDIYGVVEYFLAFANGLDLKYRSLESPEFRLHVAAILIESKFGGFPFISNYTTGEDSFYIDEGLDRSRTFFYNVRDSIPLDSYDIVLTVTELGSAPDSGILGVGYVAAACVDVKNDRALSAAAMIQDNGAFYGIHIAAHELGHVLGLRHDEQQSHNCLFTNGFIMSWTPWFTSNSTTFSECSLKTFDDALDINLYKCMYGRPRVRGTMLPKLMPGKIKTLKDVCTTLGFGLPCASPNPDENACVSMRCRSLSTDECRDTGKAAVDGTLCSDEHEPVPRYCVANQCLRV